MGKIDLSRINDRAYLESLENKELANQVLRCVLVTGTITGNITPKDIVDFKTESWTKKTFKVQYALLSDNKDIISGESRYYKDEIYCFGQPLFITNYWKPENRKYLIDWILDWVSLNVLPVTLPVIPTLIENPILPKKKKGPKQIPITPPRQGRDENRQLVYYNENVGINERVEGLCQALELEYLEYVRNFALDIFRDVIDVDFCPPEVVLCKECPSEIWTHIDSFVTRKVNELIKKGDLTNEQEIAQILRHRSRIGGEFIHNPRPLIKIYFNQFESVDWDEYFAKISQTLAHEFMHYLEYEYCKRFRRKSYNDANVSEALADFFCMIYSLKRATDRFVTVKDRIEVAEERYNEWVKWDDSGWPYAYALYFMQNRIREFSPVFAKYYNVGCIDKLRTVFLATINPKDAYDKLINL